MAALVDDSDSLDKDKAPLCEPCDHRKKTSFASVWCNDCGEYLCDTCTVTHNVSKASKGHTMMSIEDKQNSDKDTVPQFECDPCRYLSNTSIAIKFCGDCEEYLCKPCYDIHTASKASRTHQPLDIKDHVRQTQKACDMCSHKIATKYCENCEEAYCIACSDMHTALKATKNHSLINISEKKFSQIASCDVCKHINMTKPSEKYCRICDEYLCASCASSHTIMKATKSHELADPNISLNGERNTCDICLIKKIKTDAFFICKQCNEKLCSSCRDMHRTLKATRNHEISDISEEKSESDISCGQCLQKNVKKCATVFCETCVENLCIGCTGLHKRMKATSKHNLSLPNAKILEALCQPCLVGNTRIQAETFCEECDENLCTACTRLHDKQKLTKTHTLCSISNKSNINRTFCDPCLTSNDQNEAIQYCKDCDENLCEECSNSHRRQKVFRSHNLSNELKVPNAKKMCDSCNRGNGSNQATVFCENCEENFCANCEIQHNAEISTATHTLIQSKDLNTKPQKEIRYCEVCTIRKKLIPASSFCATCSKPQLFCDDCSTRHINMKANSKHVITKEVDKFNGHSEQKVSAYVKPHGKDRYSNEFKDVSPPETKIDTQADKGVAVMSRKNKDKPGKPQASKIKADSMELFWEKPQAYVPGDTFQVRHKDIDSGGKWKLLSTEYSASTIQMNDLKANTKFIFQVRTVHDEEEGPYSDISDEIMTLNSPGGRIINFATKMSNEVPYKYALPLTEVRKARFDKAKSKKFEIGSPPQQINKERTIILVGATGTGKSTLVDGLVNYILGVNWNDPYRFTIIDMESEEKDRLKNQALSQTEWITCYTINPEQGSRLDYRLTIIDTPGFGDTRGLDRDNEIVSQIRELFSAKNKQEHRCAAKYARRQSQ